ncbi:galactosyl transferase [Pyronema domesticum]|nr:galactosyl transferase [Pyronema domesticum]
MRIAIATMNTDETSYDHISLRNKFGYANKHNYALKFDLEMPKGLVPMAVWHKLNMIEYLIRTEEFDWIWWIDYDTVITNTETKLEDVILDALRSAEKADEIDFILTADCWPLNAGSMLIRSSSRVLPFLSAVWDCGDPSKSLDEPSEQDCIRDMLLKEPYSKTWGDRALWVPQTKINAFPSEVPCYDKYDKGWSPGDFVVHFAGAWAHLPQHLKKDSYGVLMRKYSEWIE